MPTGCSAQRKDGWLVVDLHGPMEAEVARRRETAPDFTFQPDAVHPNIDGHWFMARQLIRWFGDEQAASADSPEKMLAALRAPAEVMELVGKRMTVLRDAYVSAAGHKRPGVRAGLPVPEALQEAQELSKQIQQERSTRHSTGQYMGHVWHIDENGLMHWDGKPYVRFGFTGNGDSQQLMQAGFDQFTLMPAERWPISGPDPEIAKSVQETSEQLEEVGATYYGTLNAFWPWRYGNLIAESDKATVFVRDVRDVTEHAGHCLALDLQIRIPLPDVHQDRLSAESTHAVLFDLERGTRLDLSRQVESVTRIDTTPDSDAWRDGDAPPHDGPTIRVRMKSTVFPESSSLRLVLATERRSAELPGVNGLPPLWKKGIREFYQRSLIAFRPAYANPGLRGLQFGDEINTFPSSLLTAVTYLDIRHDAVALQAFREWLARQFGTVEQLNHYLGSDHASFQGVEWIVPMHPFCPELARTDDAAEREESWIGAKTAWGLADSVEQLRKISQLQEDFRQWFCGHWLAKYAEMAKEAIGPVPVFVCSAAISGNADQYLAMHRWALREGIDGLIRNHYGHCGVEERQALANVARWMAEVQQESGCTKHLWANEVGYVRPDLTDDDWAAAEKAELEPGGSFGSQWAFPSQESLRDMLVLLNQYGYRGFNRFLINPSSARAVREVQWMAELKPEIVGLVVASKQPPRTERVTREQAIAAARANSRIEHLLRGVKPVRSTAEFSDQWNVWLVHFYSGDRHVAFASVSADGEVLEVGL